MFSFVFTTFYFLHTSCLATIGHLSVKTRKCTFSVEFTSQYWRHNYSSPSLYNITTDLYLWISYKCQAHTEFPLLASTQIFWQCVLLVSQVNLLQQRAHLEWKFRVNKLSCTEHVDLPLFEKEWRGCKTGAKQNINLRIIQVGISGCGHWPY